MRETLNKLLSEHGVTDQKLLKELNTLFTECMLASKTVGKKIFESPKEEQNKMWADVFKSVILNTSDTVPNTEKQQNLRTIKEYYGIYKK